MPVVSPQPYGPSREMEACARPADLTQRQNHRSMLGPRAPDPGSVRWVRRAIRTPRCLMKIAPPRHAPTGGRGRPIGTGFVHHAHAMDARTKWVIAILLFLVLVFLVIGGIIAITTAPDACC
jgi:hypothetical protein